MITETNIKRVGSRILPCGNSGRVEESHLIAVREANAGFNCQSFVALGGLCLMKKHSRNIK